MTLRWEGDTPYLAFLPQYKLRRLPPPNLEQMISAYQAAKATGLRNIRLGNIATFVKTEEDFESLLTSAPEAI